MQAHGHPIPLIDEPGRAPIAERWAGFLLSAFLHLMLAALAVNWTFEQLRAPEPSAPSIRIGFASATPPTMSLTPIMEESQPEQLPPPVEEVIRTSSLGEQLLDRATDDSDLPELGTPVTPPPTPEVEPAELPATRDAAAADDGRPAVLSDATRRLMERQTQIAQAELAQQVITETQIQGRLFAERERERARNADYDSPGGEAGQVREIDFGDVPFAIAQQVVQRYGGTLTYGAIPEGDLQNEGPITLNAARVGDNVLTAQHHSDGGDGYTLRADGRLVSQMVYLERLELAHRGVNPSDVAITRSVFGAELSPSGWVLAVKDIEYVNVE